jgi:HlyD family secretion protein
MLCYALHAFILLLVLTGCDERQHHVALGTLERDRIALTATVNEVVVALPEAQGSPVKKGMVLVKLDDTWQQTQVGKAEAEMVQAVANLEKLRNGARREDVAAARAKVAGAKAALADSTNDYARKFSLADQKVISRADMDKALALRDADRATLHSAEEELLRLTNGSRYEDLLIAQAQLNAAGAILAGAHQQLDDLTIRATRDGILDSLPWNLGERVTMGSPVAIVLAGSAPFARVYIPEPSRAKIGVGDKLSVHIDGVAQPITGQVRWLSMQAAFTPYYALNQEERSHLMYLAEVQLPDSAAALPNGVPVQVVLP